MPISRQHCLACLLFCSACLTSFEAASVVNQNRIEARVVDARLTSAESDALNAAISEAENIVDLAMLESDAGGRTKSLTAQESEALEMAIAEAEDSTSREDDSPIAMLESAPSAKSLRGSVLTTARKDERLSPIVQKKKGLKPWQLWTPPPRPPPEHKEPDHIQRKVEEMIAIPPELQQPTEGHAADWYLEKPEKGKGWSGMVLGLVMIPSDAMDFEISDHSDKNHRAPEWLKAILSVNRDNIRRNNHQMVIRRATTLGGEDGAVPGQLKSCSDDGRRLAEKCMKGYQRVNHNWEKEAMMLDLLKDGNVSHVLIMDADAALVHGSHDTLALMASELSRTGRDILIANEDWSVMGKGRLNGGLLFAKNSDFSKSYFQALVSAHLQAKVPPWQRTGSLKCEDNEQICLAQSLATYDGLKDHLVVASGQRWNRNPCVWGHCGRDGGNAPGVLLEDPDLEVIHFMGGTKGGAVKRLRDMDLLKNASDMQSQASSTSVA